LREEGFKIIPVTKKEQLAYGINFLTVAPNKVIGVDISAKEELKKTFKTLEEKYGKSFDFLDLHEDYYVLGQNFLEKLDHHNIEYVPVKFNMLNMLYGSIHCATQVLIRTPYKDKP